MTWLILQAVLGGAAGGLVAWAGNYHVQDRVHRRFVRTDQLRKALYDYLELTANYWFAAPPDLAERRSLEGRMIIAQRVISCEFSLLAKKSKKIQRAYDETDSLRMDLWDAATGGCFEEAAWTPDPDRAKAAARAIVQIIKALDT